MKGLLLKDFYMIGKYCRFFILMNLIFLVCSVMGEEYMFYAFFPSILLGILPMTLIAYDERSKWSVYGNIFPYSRAQMVSVKYVIALIGVGTATLLTFIMQCLRMFQNSSVACQEAGIIAMISGIVGMINPSIILPFIFKYGVEKGRIIYYIGLVGISSVSVMIFKCVNLMEVLPNIEGSLFLVLLGVIVLFALSWLLSIRIYQKKEL
ncbi:ABC-2 transporter permease [Roseburia sp. 499]|uniref:ABC-2 transporter permease n=1 Tax=Roseburia sp. 499 TaxID=1261634 RepID=UPI00095193EB|nr:ABC-2 transporter permease [Roseburia sp. 499]WVK71144.1 ABC-2 transporter permease [Roseburia sp. 499]